MGRPAFDAAFERRFKRLVADLDPALIDRFAAIVGDKYALRDQADIAPYITERRGHARGRA
ncbi:hypothetical protein EN810_35990, partial [Mesorhizobium sp. M8A.F.Ca.ET.167.01.1.1]